MKRTPLPNGWHMVDDSDLLEVEAIDSVEADPPAPLPFPLRAPDGGIADVASVLRAADEACRRIEVLARDLECLGEFEDDGDGGPRAA